MRSRRKSKAGRTGTRSPRRLNEDEWNALVEKQARKHMNMGAEEFLRRWKRGEFSDEDACPEAQRVAMLLPVGW